MAVFTKTIDYQHVLQTVKKGQIAPSYLIFGEETFLIDRLVEEVSAAFLGEIQKEINFFIRYASDTPVEKLLVLLSGGGLFSDKKLIVYKDVQLLRSPQLAKILAYVKQPDENICLILICRADRLPGSKFEKIANLAETVQVGALKSADLIRFIENEFQKFEKTLAVHAAEALIYFVGEQIHDLQTQIIQIAQYYDEKKEITAEDIEAIAGIYANQTVFELVKNVADRKLQPAHFVLHNLLERGESVQGILYFLIRHFNILFKLRGYLISKKYSEQQIRKELKVYPKHYAEYKRQLQFWTSQRLRQALFLLRKADEELKSGLSSPDLILDILIFKLINLS